MIAKVRGIIRKREVTMVANILSPDPDRQKLLDAVPSPDDIRRQMAKRIEEGRLLRSLYRLSQRIAKAKQSGEVAHVA